MPVVRVKVVIFTLQGLVAAFAGLVLAARMTSGQPNTSQGFELEVISACVLGGVSLSGGVARIGFVVAGGTTAWVKTPVSKSERHAMKVA